MIRHRATRVPDPVIREDGRRHAFRGERGGALIMVVLIGTVSSILAGVTYNTAMHSTVSAAVSGKLVDSTAAADAGLNLAIQSIGSNTQPSLPCGSGAVTGNLGTVPSAASYSASITYYANYPPTTALTCSQVTGGTATPAAALVSSTGTTTSPLYGNSEMQALLELTPVPGGGFNDAIFANGTITFNNQTTINGEPGYGSNANLYSNQSMSCTNNEVVHGSVWVQGSFTASNTCSVDGTVYSTGNITFSNSGTVGGDLKSSRGSITLNGTNTVNGSAIANGSVTVGAQASVLGNVVSNAVLPDPGYQAFPALTYSSSLWSAAGYANQITDNDCNSGDEENVYKDIASMSSSSTPTVIQTSCALNWANNTSLTLGASLAVISTGGFTTTNRFSMSTSSSSPVDLFWIVPSGTSCSGGGAITTSNNAQISPPIDVFMYSPCDVTFSNNQGTFGQVYSGGNVSITNLYTMTYIPMAVPNLSGVGNQLAFQTSTIYVRQVPPGT